jgi:phosphoglycerate kinase
MVVLGGAKIADKIPVLEALLDRVDSFLIGGGMAYSLLKAEGKKVGKSKADDALADTCRRILERARAAGKRFLLPVDHQVARGIDDLADYGIVEGDIPPNVMGLDIGPLSVGAYARELREARTVFWNGPLGVFERPPFQLGTLSIATYLAFRGTTTKTVVGGGDSAAAARELGLVDKMGFVSTGGGASLEFVQGVELPGIAALPDA